MRKFLIWVSLVIVWGSAFSQEALPASETIVHDPVMIQQDGTYYIFCTGRGISVFSSKDMKSWTKQQPVFETAPAWGTTVAADFKNHIWAPDVSFHNGQYYLYYSVSSFAKNTSAIGVATNKTLNPADKNFKWTSSINLSIPKNKLLEYTDLAKSVDANKYIIGQSTRIARGFEFTGVDPATGVAQFSDLNGDNALTTADYVTLGNLMPEFYGGVNNSFSYSGLALNFLFQFVKQEGPGLAYGPLAGNLGGLTNFDVSVLDRWQKPGDITDIPRASTLTSSLAYTRYTSNYRYSTAAWEDASFIRLKNVSLSYDITKWAEKINVKRASINFNAQNLITWTSFRGLDPEIQGFDRSFVSGVNPFGSSRTASTPTMRTFTFGIQLTL
ncbi:MAG: hypothetical protein EOO98_04040 [Pedobacter sp.]|nr:MAG: hypothetical protein EOO98_04040 [Pedobacter sp.]